MQEKKVKRVPELVDVVKGSSMWTMAEDRYIIHVPEKLTLAGVAPLLCAGITVYSPLKYYGLSTLGLNIGVVGLGGLGHVAVKFAKAFGAIDNYLVELMQAATRTFDGIIDTVSVVHPSAPLLNLLKTNGKLVVVGAPAEPLDLYLFPMIMDREHTSGRKLHRRDKRDNEMLDFAAEKEITAEVEVWRSYSRV